MKKETTVKAHTRKGKNGKTVNVRQHTTHYESAEDMVKDAIKNKKGAGKELAQKKKGIDDWNNANIPEDLEDKKSDTNELNEAFAKLASNKKKWAKEVKSIKEGSTFDTLEHAQGVLTSAFSLEHRGRIWYYKRGREKYVIRKSGDKYVLKVPHFKKAISSKNNGK